MTEIDMASSSLETLKKAVLLGLHEDYQSGKPSQIAEIYEWLGIERIKLKGTYDQLIHGVLVRLRQRGYARHQADPGTVYACNAGEWEITEEGISAIQVINDSQGMFKTGLKELKRLVLGVLDRYEGPMKPLEIHEQLGIKKLTRADHDTENDHLIEGVLFFLQDEKRALRVPYKGWQIQRKE